MPHVAEATWCREFIGVGSSSPFARSRFWIPWGREPQELEQRFPRRLPIVSNQKIISVIFGLVAIDQSYVSVTDQ